MTEAVISGYRKGALGTNGLNYAKSSIDISRIFCYFRWLWKSYIGCLLKIYMENFNYWFAFFDLLEESKNLGSPHKFRFCSGFFGVSVRKNLRKLTLFLETTQCVRVIQGSYGWGKLSNSFYSIHSTKTVIAKLYCFKIFFSSHLHNFSVSGIQIDFELNFENLKLFICIEVLGSLTRSLFNALVTQVTHT